MNIDELWGKYATWTEGIGEWIHKANFTEAIAEIISLPVEAQVKHANGVYSMNECIFQYCPTPNLCKKENKCLKCRHLNIVKYCKNCNMDIHDETMSDCLVCREKLVTKCEDCLEILD